MTTTTPTATAAVAEELVAFFKPTGKRQSMEEMALYTVKDGKVVEEHFFYNPNSA